MYHILFKSLLIMDKHIFYYIIIDDNILTEADFPTIVFGSI